MVEWEVLIDVRGLDGQMHAGEKSPELPKRLAECPLLASIIIVRLILFAVKVRYVMVDTEVNAKFGLFDCKFLCRPSATVPHASFNLFQPVAAVVGKQLLVAGKQRLGYAD